MDTIAISKQYLEPTNLVDFNIPIAQQKALELTKNSRSEMEKVKGIYNYVRDDIPYTFTHNLQKTSDVLKEYIGQCNTKTTLTVALLRAVDIPARYHCRSVSKILFKNIILIKLLKYYLVIQNTRDY
ncbi:MAG: transglutaminase-like putative cysteine protease [Maribacter sp.]|jgi:transglutaminase-like putative cysteine protease